MSSTAPQPTRNCPLEAANPDIQANLRAVREQIAAAEAAAGRAPGSVRLIAVSKYQPATAIQQAIAAGQTAFGENTVQEARTRQALLAAPGTEWHFIGHLQTNKAKHIAGNFTWLHTLDSIKLAHKLSAGAATTGNRLNLLLQVNIAKDPAKFGLPVDAVAPFVEELLEADLPGVCLRGLMTIGRRDATAAERMADFSGLQALGEACAGQFGADHFRELSMGMSHDFAAAIRAGATMVRVGTAIFGARPVVEPGGQGTDR